MLTTTKYLITTEDIEKHTGLSHRNLLNKLYALVSKMPDEEQAKYISKIVAKGIITNYSISKEGIKLILDHTWRHTKIHQYLAGVNVDEQLSLFDSVSTTETKHVSSLNNTRRIKMTELYDHYKYLGTPTKVVSVATLNQDKTWKHNSFLYHDIKRKMENILTPQQFCHCYILTKDSKSGAPSYDITLTGLYLLRFTCCSDHKQKAIDKAIALLTQPEAKEIETPMIEMVADVNKKEETTISVPEIKTGRNDSHLVCFNNEKFGIVRTILINGEPWFVGKDIADALGYSDTVNALKQHVHDDDKTMGWRNTTPSESLDTSGFYVFDALGRKQYPAFINESGMYALIFGSQLENAKEFKHWVTSTVLPSIRKTGSFSDVKLPQLSPLEVLAKVAENLVTIDKKVQHIEIEQAHQKDAIKENQDMIMKIANCMLVREADWRRDTNITVKRLINDSLALNPKVSFEEAAGKIYGEIYRIFSLRAQVNLPARLDHYIKRTNNKNANYLDVIGSDKRLREIYVQVVREISIRALTKIERKAS